MTSSFLPRPGLQALIDFLGRPGQQHSVLGHLQTGYLYHYAFAMIIGLALMLGWLLFKVIVEGETNPSAERPSG